MSDNAMFNMNVTVKGKLIMLYFQYYSIKSVSELSLIAV